MTSMLELVEASAGVYPLSYGPGMDLSPPTVSGWHSRGVDFMTAVLPSRGTHTSSAISSFATQRVPTCNMQHSPLARGFPVKERDTNIHHRKKGNTHCTRTFHLPFLGSGSSNL